MSIRNFSFLVIFLAIVLIAGAGYYFFVLNEQGPKLTDKQVESPNSIELLAEGPIISPILSFSGETVWYMNQAGRLFRKSFINQEPAEEFSLPSGLRVPTKVIWPREGSDFIVEEVLDGHVRYHFFDASSQTFLDYSPQVRQVNFLPDFKKIVYDWVSGEGRHQLKIADVTGENFHTVAELYRPDNQIVVSPTREEVLLFVASIVDQASVYLADLKTGEFREIASGGSYSGASFSPDGNLILLSGSRPLQIISRTTLEERTLSMDEEIDQTVWSADSSAVIIGTEQGFWKYELASRETKELYKFLSDENYLPRNLIIHPNEKNLLFVDSRNGNLYRVDLE